MSTTFEVHVLDDKRAASVARFRVDSHEVAHGEYKLTFDCLGVLGNRHAIAHVMERIARLWPKHQSCLEVK